MNNLKILAEHGVDLVNNTIYLNGDVDGELYDFLMQGLAMINLGGNKEMEKTTIVLSTYGGDVYFGLAMYDAIKVFAGQTKIICSGPVMSAGTIILQAADERVMMENSHLLVHYGMEVNGDTNTKIQHEMLQKRMKAVLIDKCSAKPATIKKWFTKESYFDTKRAIEVGLVDGAVSHE